MKIKRLNKHKPLLYILVVIIPTIILTAIWVNHRLDYTQEENEANSKWVASVHKQQIEQLMMESSTSLEILTITMEELTDPIIQSDATHRILERAKNGDPRYGGLYVLDNEGTVIDGTEDNIIGSNLSNNEYIQNVCMTKNTVISDEQEILLDHLSVLPVAAPILNNKNECEGMMIAHIRLDYLINVMNILTPEEVISVQNIDGDLIFGLNLEESIESSHSNWVQLPMDTLPWTISVQVKDVEISPLLANFLLLGFINFIVANVCYIVIQFFLLMKRAAFEKSQNEAQKLELVGTLAASTAHEIRNPLTGIKGLIQLLSEKYKSKEDQLYFSVIDKEVERINEIVSEFLILGKPTILKTEKIDLKEILEELKPLIQSEANLYNVLLSITMPTQPLIISCAKVQLKQVILNITKNALEAMEAEGILAIEVKLQNNHVILTVTDTGVGMTTEELTHIFQPFYSSKEFGTGLGLVVCKRIIESFNGSISITSQKNMGTTVTVKLPSLQTSNQ